MSVAQISIAGTGALREARGDQRSGGCKEGECNAPVAVYCIGSQ